MLDTRDIMDSSVAESVRQVEAIGNAQYQVFVTERFEKHTSLVDPIKRNKLSMFLPPSKAKSSDKMQITSLKSNCSLFSRLCVSC